MSGRFDKFFDYAYEKGRDIAKKFHGNKGDKMDKKGMNIESYDGQDAFYTGTDEEYEEFLKNVDVKTDNDADAEPVENTQRINLNETINIQSVIDKFKKKAGDIENGARKFKDTVVSKVDEFKAKKEAENTTEAENEKEEKKKEYKELHIPDEQLDMILSDMYTQEEYIDHQKRIFIEDNVDAILRNEFGSLLPIGDVLDAIYEGKLHSNTLKDSQGEAICRTGGHGLNYYYATLHGFDEMIANFAAISKANDAKEKLRMLKSIVGDGVYDMIRNFYYQDILKINLEENKVHGGKR